jgi:hypothetical protein
MHRQSTTISTKRGRTSSHRFMDFYVSGAHGQLCATTLIHSPIVPCYILFSAVFFPIYVLSHLWLLGVCVTTRMKRSVPRVVLSLCEWMHKAINLRYRQCGTTAVHRKRVWRGILTYLYFECNENTNNSAIISCSNDFHLSASSLKYYVIL